MSYESPHAVTLADTPPVLRLQTEKADRRLMHVTGLNLETAPRASKAAPVDSQHSIQGTPTTRVGHAPVQEASHHQRHTGPHREGARPSLQTRPRAPPHGIPKGSARAGRAQRPRRRHSVWQRINALSARATLPQGQETLEGHKSHIHDRSRAATRLAAPQKNGPAPTQPPALPRQ